MYGDSQALYADDGSICPMSSEVKEIPFAKSGEFVMDSDKSYSEYKQYNSYQNNSGLLRFRSAPSSLFENFSDGDDKNIGKNSVETQELTSRRFSSSVLHSSHVSHGVHVLEDSKAMVNSYALNSQLPPQYPRPNGITQLGSVNGGFRVQKSMGIDHQGQPKVGSNLMRQSSSPAGLFSHLTAQNGYATRRSVASFGISSGASGDLSPSSNRLKVPMDFSSGMPSSLGLMLSRISEVETETCGTNCPRDAKLGNGNGDTQFYDSGFPFGGWNSSSKFAENFNGLKREVDNDQDLFSQTLGGDPRNRPLILSHHVSLPKTSAEIAAMEKLLQLQDTVPCKIRAKRGCATHPRSIAERVRRTRISERMRKLQELVPNMEKQTNTADMLDLAVEYIKELQNQYKTLTGARANCKCSAMQKPAPDQMF